MNIYIQRKKSGFTLIELLVVIAIITILLSIILAAVATARQNTREKKRISDLGNIEFALTIYKEGNAQHAYPVYTSETLLGVGSQTTGLNGDLRPLNGTVPMDPLDGTIDYGYYYDSSFNCTAANQAVIYAKNMEQSKNSNFSTVCTGTNTITGGTNVYIVILKQ
jgi:prepilin-type N-terminal cleavage/methylation domain-containing protein